MKRPGPIRVANCTIGFTSSDNNPKNFDLVYVHDMADGIILYFDKKHILKMLSWLDNAYAYLAEEE